MALTVPPMAQLQMILSNGCCKGEKYSKKGYLQMFSILDKKLDCTTCHALLMQASLKLDLSSKLHIHQIYLWICFREIICGVQLIQQKRATYSFKRKKKRNYELKGRWHALVILLISGCMQLNALPHVSRGLYKCLSTNIFI